MTEAYSHQALAPDTMIQEYRIVKVLGVGSFGIVYSAENKYFDETVAIKEYLPSDLACRQEGSRVVPLSSETEETYGWALQNFLKEAKILWDLSHPEPHRSIVRVLRFIEENGTAYMVMDYEEGQELSQILDQRGALPEAELKDILWPLLDGLERVHAASIWHRDIKPSNILIRQDGSPVFIDFGAAKREMPGAAKSIMAVFSPAYAAPEQVVATGHQGPWTDIYAFGATLYRAVCGDKPTNATERMRGADHTTAAVSAQGNYAPVFLEAIDAALELKHEDRPQSIKDWRGLFEKATGTAIAAEDDATVVRSSSPDPMSDFFPTDAPTVAKEMTEPEPSPVDQPELAPKANRRLTYIFLGLVLMVALGAGAYIFYKKSDIITGPSKEEILEKIKAMLVSYECAVLTPILSEGQEGLDMALAGFVSRPEDLERVKSEMGRIEDVSKVNYDLKVHPWPFCEMLKLLDKHQNNDLSPAMRTRLESSNPDGRYQEGEFLSLNITTSPAFDGYLYVDYLDSLGNIVHMLPAPKRTDNAVRAGQRIIVGAEPSKKSDAIYYYKIEPPHGRNLIVAISSPKPLFDIPRPHIESALQYFTALNDALKPEEMTTSPAGVVTAYTFFDTYK
jgi:serine/threonine protein kinase